MLRRNIANHLVFGYNRCPREITNALKELSSRSEGFGIVKTELERPGQDQKSNLYSLTCPTPEQISRVHHLENLKKEILNPNCLGRSGEKYSRSLLKAAGFVRVTQERRLGRIFDLNGDHSLDLAATNPVTGMRYGVSVKNVNEWLFPGNRFIDDCIRRARSHGLEPWLIIPFVSSDARASCEARGVKLTELGAQIVPAEADGHKHMRNQIACLRETIGPQPFEYHYVGSFENTAKHSPQTQLLVAQLARETARVAA